MRIEIAVEMSVSDLLRRVSGPDSKSTILNIGSDVMAALEEGLSKHYATVHTVRIEQVEE